MAGRSNSIFIFKRSVEDIIAGAKPWYAARSATGNGFIIEELFPTLRHEDDSTDALSPALPPPPRTKISFFLRNNVVPPVGESRARAMPATLWTS